MLRVAMAAMAASFIVPIETVKQPPEAPPALGETDYAALTINPPALLSPWAAPNSPPAPHIVVLILCRTDDLTGRPGRHPPEMAARDWRDLEPHVENGELQCKRVELPLEDSTPFNANATADTIPLNPNFGDPVQCARAGILPATTYHDRPGWSVLALGCPTPITDRTGRIVGWKLPDCPRQIKALRGITCKFDESVI